MVQVLAVLVYQGSSFSVSRVLWVQVFQDPDFKVQVWVQILEVALLIWYNYSFLDNFVLIHFRCPLGALKKDVEFSEAPTLSFWKKYTFLYKNQKKIGEAEYQLLLFEAFQSQNVIISFLLCTKPFNASRIF